jgi:flagellar basal-body rod protein FlgB
MLENLFNSTKTQAVKKSLEAQMLRSRVIANNIANVNTPGYKRVEVKFEDELRSALSDSKLKGTRTDKQHMKLGKGNIAHVTPKAYRPVDPTLPSGVNNVDIDTEMAKLAETQILYNYGTKFVGIKKLNAAIQGKPLPGH